MKFGTYFAYWENEWDVEFLRYCRKASRLGFDVLEVNGTGIYSMEKKKLNELKNEAAGDGIILTACIGFSKETDVSSDNAETRAAGLEYSEKLIDNMNTAGIRKLNGIIYSCWPFDYSTVFDKERMRANAVTGLQKMADYAGQYGITLNLEVVNRFENPLLNCAAEAVDFVKEVDRPNVKILLDTFHMNIEEDTFYGAIECAGKDLGHFHIGEANRKVPGKGHLPWDEIGCALRDIGYDGYIVMEPFVKMGGHVGSDIRVWRDLSNNADEAKLDADIAEALHFVKAKFA